MVLPVSIRKNPCESVVYFKIYYPYNISLRLFHSIFEPVDLLFPMRLYMNPEDQESNIFLDNLEPFLALRYPKPYQQQPHPHLQKNPVEQ